MLEDKLDVGRGPSRGLASSEEEWRRERTAAARHQVSGFVQPRSSHPHLDVAHDVALERDLDLVILDVPAGDVGEPSEDGPALGDHVTPPIDEGALLGRAEPLRVSASGPHRRMTWS